MPDSIISVKNVTFTYENAEAPAVNDVSLAVTRGEFLAILGRNGSGKSTLAKLFNALLLPASGEIVVDGIISSEENSYDIRRACGMVFQNPDNQIVATIVEEDCAFGLENTGVPHEEIRPRVAEALSAVDMLKHAEAAPHMLSGGQKQRVAIAGVLAMRPKIIVFDESTAMLDPSGRTEVMNVAKRLNAEGITIIWITHFMEEAAQAERLMIMHEGRIAVTGTPREIFTDTEKLSELGMTAPAMTRLAHELIESGVDIPADILSVDEMAVALCRSK